MTTHLSPAPNLLVLTGVRLCEFSTREPTLAVEPKENMAPLLDMPKKFTGSQQWPRISNLKCWECDQVPADYPKFIPLHPERLDNIITADVYGHFCRWNCAVRHILKEFPKNQQWDSLETLYTIESQFSGRPRRDVIPPAPPKTLMRQYCGNNGLTVKQWEEKLEHLNTDFTLSQYKISHFIV